MKKKRSAVARKRDFWLTMLLVPGIIWFVVFKYLPMFGIVMAFKAEKIIIPGRFVQNVMANESVGLDNFRFMFATEDALNAIKNTLLYNLFWIFLTTLISLAFALILNEINSKKLVKTGQTMMFFPYFLSWVVVNYFLYAFLAPRIGMLSALSRNLSGSEINWYMEPKYWPFILTLATIWKSTGYNSVVYLAAICGIDSELYEAAAIDGATKRQQIWRITLPLLKPMIAILLIMSFGRIISADFGLFYNLPREQGALFQATTVLDTYIYRAFISSGRTGYSTAAGLFQSGVGLIMILLANWVTKLIDPENTLF